MDYRFGCTHREYLRPATGRETLPIREHALPRPNRNWPSPVCWEMDMIADVSRRMPADIRHNIAPECQEARAARKDLMLRSERSERLEAWATSMCALPTLRTGVEFTPRYSRGALLRVR